MAELIAKTRPVRITPLDVVDHNATTLPLQLYDGKTIPFADDAFDVGLVSFVLHHAQEPDVLLKESRRVAMRLIIVEDTPVRSFDIKAWRFWDNLMNHAHHPDVAVAHEAKSNAEWQAFFEARGLRVVYQKTFRTMLPVLKTYPHTVFVLDKE